MAPTSQVYFSLITQVGGGKEVRGSKHAEARHIISPLVPWAELSHMVTSICRGGWEM